MYACLDAMPSKINALKLQINFRKKVLGKTHADKSYFLIFSQPIGRSTRSEFLGGGSSPQELSPDQLREDPELLMGRAPIRL